MKKLWDGSETDCIKKPDGTMICYDMEDKCYYRLNKTVVKPSELDEADILALMDKFAHKASDKQ